jgi:hypothetical protein
MDTFYWLSFGPPPLQVIKSLSSVMMLDGQNFLSNCHDACTEWLSSVLSLEEKFKGNLVAIPEVDSTTGKVRVTRTGIVDSGLKSSNKIVYIGEEGCTQSLNHGSVVALHCSRHNRFLRLFQGKADSPMPHDINQLPGLCFHDRLFLVVKLSSDQCAFYNIGSAQFLGMNGGEQLVGFWPVVEPCSTGFTDQAFIDQIPQDAIFTVTSERSDNGEFSLYSSTCQRFVRMTDKGVVDGAGKRALAWERFQVLVVMDSSSIGVDQEFIEQSTTLHCSILKQSAKVFMDWTRALPTTAECKLGNLVATAHVHPTSGHILFPKTERFYGPDNASQQGIQQGIHLGKLVNRRCLSNGNVVALYNAHHSRFVRIHEGLASTAQKIPCEELPLVWGSEQFLVVSCGGDDYAFYSFHQRQFLGMKRPDLVVGIRPSVDLLASPDDNTFIGQIPNECIFLVGAEQSDESEVSLYSPFHYRFITVHGNSTVYGAGAHPRDSQAFRIVLLMDVEVSESSPSV